MMGSDFSYPLPNVDVEKIGPFGNPGRYVNKVTVTEKHPYLDIKSLNHSPKHRFAIVTLSISVVPTTKIGPLCLPEDPSRNTYREQGTVFGFGYRESFLDIAKGTDPHRQKQRTIVSQTYDTIDVTKSCRKEFGSFALESKWKREGWAGWMEM